MGYLEVDDEGDIPEAREALIEQVRAATGKPNAPFLYHIEYVPDEEHFELAVAIELDTTGRGRD